MKALAGSWYGENEPQAVRDLIRPVRNTPFPPRVRRQGIEHSQERVQEEPRANTVAQSMEVLDLAS